MVTRNVAYYASGSLLCEEYLEDNKLHHYSRPAITRYWENGNVRTQKYYTKGEYHREDGSVMTWYYINGNIEQYIMKMEK